MQRELFSDRWATAWCTALNASAAYAAASGDWAGTVALVMPADGDQAPRAVYLESGGGRCRAARAASTADLDAAEYVFEARPEIWGELLAGRMAPVMALMTGKLRLTRGSLATLMPHVAAARELIATAGAVTAAEG